MYKLLFVEKHSTANTTQWLTDTVDEHLANTHITDGYLANTHITDGHLANTHITNGYLANTHITDGHLAHYTMMCNKPSDKHCNKPWDNNVLQAVRQ